MRHSTSQVSVDPLFIATYRSVPARGWTPKMAKMAPVAPALCSGRSTWNGMILQALAIWYFINYKHKLATTARSVLLYICVCPLYKPQTRLFLETKGKYTVLLKILKKPKQTLPPKSTSQPTKHHKKLTKQKEPNQTKNQNHKKNPQTTTITKPNKNKTK